MGTKSLQVIDLEMHRGWGWGWGWAWGGSLCSFGGFQTLKASAGSSGTGSWLDVLGGLDQRGSHPVLQMQPVSSSKTSGLRVFLSRPSSSSLKPGVYLQRGLPAAVCADL